MKKILTFICVFTIGFISLFNVKTNYNSFLSASAYNETYNYISEVSSSYNSIDSYAIDSIESINYGYGTVVKISFTVTGSNRNLFWFSGELPSSSVSNLSYFSFEAPDNTSIFLIANSGSISFDRSNSGLLYVSVTAGSYDLYFSYDATPVYNSGRLGFRTSYIALVDDISSFNTLVDMSSSKTLISFESLSYYQSLIPNSFFTEVLSYSFNVSYPRSFSTNYTSSGTLMFNNFSNYSFSVSFSRCDFNIIDSYVDSSSIYNNNHGYNVNFVFGSFDFVILRPTYRVNNTLIIYNYDYLGLLSAVYSVSYSLLRGNDLYNILYSGSVPNEYFSYFYNSDIQNILFDEYISLSFGIDSSVLFPAIMNLEDYSYSFYSGFDFNFTYYAEPLNSSNGIYSYIFNKPSYVAMQFSLYPFYLPVLEMVENALIFLLFYCPIISDILELLHMSEFLGALITVINYYTTGVLGTFITALISFFIFYLFFKSILPTVSSGVGSMVDNSYIGYISNSKKEEKYTKKRNRKELRHRSKLIDKEYKKRERNKKRGIPD